MVLSPVGSDDYHSVLAEVAHGCKLPNTEVHVPGCADPDGSFTRIECRSCGTIVSRSIVQTIRQAAPVLSVASAIPGCMVGARRGERPCVASCETVSNLATNCLGIILGRRERVNRMNAVVREHGHGENLSGFCHAELGVNDFWTDHAETERRLHAAGRKAVEEDNAEASFSAARRRSASASRSNRPWTYR